MVLYGIRVINIYDEANGDENNEDTGGRRSIDDDDDDDDDDIDVDIDVDDDDEEDTGGWRSVDC